MRRARFILAVAMVAAAAAAGCSSDRLQGQLDQPEHRGFGCGDFTENPFRFAFDLEERALGVVTVDRRAYVADGTAGLKIVDVGDPAAPWLVGRAPTENAAIAVAVQGPLALVAEARGDPLASTFASSFEVIDVTDPAAPEVVGLVEITAVAVAWRGNYGLAVAPDSLRVIDLTDPTQPIVVATWDGGLTYPDFGSVAVDGEHAFIGDSNNGLIIVDLSDPTQPALSAAHPTPGLARGVAVEEDVAYVADGFDLHVVDVSNPSAPVDITTLPVESPGFAYGVVVDDGRAFVSAQFGGLLVIDGAASGTPEVIGHYPTAGIAFGVALADGLAVVADGAALRLIDVSAPRRSALVGAAATDGVAHRVDVTRQHAYVAYASIGPATSSGLGIFDISEPTAPLERGSFPTTGRVRDVLIEDGRAYLAEMMVGLQIIDVSIPSAPVWFGAANTPGSPRGVALAGDHIYLADGSQGLRVLSRDLSMVASVPTGDIAQAVAAGPGRAYIAAGHGGLRIFDTRVAGPPQLRGTLVSLDAAGEATDDRDVVARGEMLFVANGDLGLRIIDAADPATPVVASACSFDAAANGVSLRDELATVATSTAVQIFDVTEAAVPHLREAYASRSTAFDAALVDQYVAVADGRSGLGLIERVSLPVIEVPQRIQIAGATVELSVTFWPRSEAPDERVVCRASAGSCAVLATNPADGSARVRWTLPEEPGQPEIRVAVGNYHYFAVAREWLDVR